MNPSNKNRAAKKQNIHQHTPIAVPSSLPSSSTSTPSEKKMRLEPILTAAEEGSIKKNLSKKLIRRAREYSLQFLYHYQLPSFQSERKKLQKVAADSMSSQLPRENNGQNKIEEEIRFFNQYFTPQFAGPYQEFSTQIIRGTLENYSEIESKIKECVPHWNINHLFKIDLTLLTMSFFELIYLSDTPKNVIINEAIELAKKYGSEDSSKFVNGVLDAAAKRYCHS